MTQRTYSCVGVDKNGRVEIIANDQGNRTIPSYVSIAADERIVGDAARKQFAVNVKNTVFDAKRLIGRRFSDPVVQEVMKHWSFEVVRATATSLSFGLSSMARRSGSRWRFRRRC